MAVTLQNRPVVLFRSTDGAVTALHDRCPHRNVPLSMGRVRDGQLECAYHGWRFDASGACVAVPGLMREDLAPKSRCVERYATRELDGFVWLYATPGLEPSHEPFRFPHLTSPGYTTVRRRFQVKASLHAVLENTLDVPHTAFLHGGLFRTATKKNTVEVLVRRHERHAEAEFVGEPAPRGLAGRLLAPGGGLVQHVDRFILPSIAQVEYRLGTASHLLATTFFTPVSDHDMLVFAVVTFRLPLPGWLIKPLVAPIAAHIFRQDAALLARQQEQIQKFGGEHFASTELDVLGPHITVLLEQSATGAPATLREHRVRIKT
jgi:phenylpropionate dioxygenase-like ring-hydroxylating dioxygenase large terminal subunit